MRNEADTGNDMTIYPSVGELAALFEGVIPRGLSLDWDNDGLQVCPDESAKVKKALLTLDVTGECVRFAAENGFDMIISHHPVIFKPLRALTSPKLTALIRGGITVMSFHTRLDILEGGVNDMLAAMLEINGIQTFAEGAGRIGALDYAWDFDKWLENVKTTLNAPLLKYARGGDIAHVVAVVSGSGGDFTNEAAALGADTFLSGELGYHHMLDAAESGMNAVEAGHYWTEQHITAFFERLISDNFPSVTTCTYGRDPVGFL